MNSANVCIMQLEARHLFDSEEHRARFGDLVKCYYKFPFFTPGLCKCMYLSSWDEEHFFVMLDILNSMTMGKDQNTEEMEDNGKVQEAMLSGRDKEIFRLSGAFLSGEDYIINMDGLDREAIHIITMALEAADVIDRYMSE